jgi:autotransporter-associated beta strand protein
MVAILECARSFLRTRSKHPSPPISRTPEHGTMKPTFSLRHFLLIAGSSLMTISSASAQSIWDGSDDALWSTAGNWDTAPADGDALTFSGTSNQTNTNDTALTNIGLLTLSNAGWNIGLGTLTLNSGITASGTSSLTGTLTLGAAQTWQNSAGTLSHHRHRGQRRQPPHHRRQSETPASPAPSAARAGFTKSGTGILTLTGANDYTGTTTPLLRHRLRREHPQPGSRLLRPQHRQRRRYHSLGAHQGRLHLQPRRWRRCGRRDHTAHQLRHRQRKPAWGATVNARPNAAILLTGDKALNSSFSTTASISPGPPPTAPSPSAPAPRPASSCKPAVPAQSREIQATNTSSPSAPARPFSTPSETSPSNVATATSYRLGWSHQDRRWHAHPGQHCRYICQHNDRHHEPEPGFTGSLWRCRQLPHRQHLQRHQLQRRQPHPP